MRRRFLKACFSAIVFSCTALYAGPAFAVPNPPPAAAEAILQKYLIRTEDTLEWARAEIQEQTELAITDIFLTAELGGTVNQLKKIASNAKKANKRTAGAAQREFNRINGGGLIDLLRAQAARSQTARLRTAVSLATKRLKVSVNAASALLDAAVAEASAP